MSRRNRSFAERHPVMSCFSARSQTRNSSAARIPQRAAFTMLEILLVLGVLALFLAVAWPSVLRLNGQQTLVDSAEKVRTLVASARVHAIESGLVYQFRYEPAGRHFVVIPFEREFEGASPMARDSGASGLGRFSKASGTLPVGVVFSNPTAAVARTSTGNVTNSTTTGQQISADALSGLPDAGKLAAISWSGPILFQPDGSGMDAVIEITDRRRQHVTLRVRGITGAVSVSRLHEVERP